MDLTLLAERIQRLADRGERFTYDLRGECRVYTGIVAAYRATPEGEHFPDLPLAVAHALAHDGIIGSWKTPGGTGLRYDSCRLFTSLPAAILFAQQQRQAAVFNLNRMEEVPVPAVVSAPAH